MGRQYSLFKVSFAQENTKGTIMIKNTGIILFATVLLLVTTTRLHAQDAVQFNPASVPSEGRKAEDFVPRGWKIAAATSGDLNGDLHNDQVIQLVPKDYEPEGVVAAPEAQALLICLSSADGKLHRAAVTTKLLASSVPQFILQLSIKNGVLVVNENYGMTDVLDLTYRFRHDAKSGRFVLIGKDTYNYHRPQGPNWPGVLVSENYLTGVRITTTDRWLKNGTNKPTTQRERITHSQVFIEDIDEDSTN